VSAWMELISWNVVKRNARTNCVAAIRQMREGSASKRTRKANNLRHSVLFYIRHSFTLPSDDFA
jgi:hypothetical protein